MMEEWIPLIELSDLPEGNGLRLCKAGLDLALFRIGDVVYAIDDSCPHAGASLSNGRLRGKTVHCRAHGLGFDLESDSCAGVPMLPINRYAVGIVDGVVMLKPNETHSRVASGSS
jgi:nitrite reductase/ring-hydroxylating ferredoxin subunit